MKYTSAEAAKLLKSLIEDQDGWKEREEKAGTFVAAIEEDVESVRPRYDYEETQQRLAWQEERVRKLKHAINMFNCTTMVPGFDMTIDQMLVYIPQLSERKRRLARMGARLPKERMNQYGARNIVEYTYANYDVDKAEADAVATANELARAQTALDLVNSTVTMDIDI